MTGRTTPNLKLDFDMTLPTISFDVPAPPTPRQGETGTDWNAWDLTLRYYDLKQRFDNARRHEEQTADLIEANADLALANAAFAAANEKLAQAMRDAAELQLQAAQTPVVSAPVVQTDADILLHFYTAGLASGEDGGTLTSEAVAALKAYRKASKTDSI